MVDRDAEIKLALKNIYSDPRWQIRKPKSKFLRYAEIAEVKVGVAFATNNKPEYSNVALNCAHFERLRDGRAAGKVDRIFVVASRTNGEGKPEYRGYVDAEALYENKLRHQTPINGLTYGPFWSLSPDEFEVDEEEPF